MVVEPTATDEARPLFGLIVAEAGSDELHVACVVKSWTVLSVKTPVAVNCWLLPTAILGFVGVIPIDTSVADVTVRVVLPETVPEVAVIRVEPAAADVARPLEPAVLLTAATAGSAELQVTDAVRSCLVLSEKIPVAVNCLVVPIAILGLAGVTSIDTSVADVTVRVVLPVTVPDVAVIRVEPAATDVVWPLEPDVLLTAATAGSDELQVTEVVRS